MSCCGKCAVGEYQAACAESVVDTVVARLETLRDQVCAGCGPARSKVSDAIDLLHEAVADMQDEAGVVAGLGEVSA